MSWQMSELISIDLQLKFINLSLRWVGKIRCWCGAGWVVGWTERRSRHDGADEDTQKAFAQNIKSKICELERNHEAWNWKWTEGSALASIIFILNIHDKNSLIEYWVT